MQASELLLKCGYHPLSPIRCLSGTYIRQVAIQIRQVTESLLLKCMSVVVNQIPEVESGEYQVVN